MATNDEQLTKIEEQIKALKKKQNALKRKQAKQKAEEEAKRIAERNQKYYDVFEEAVRQKGLSDEDIDRMSALEIKAIMKGHSEPAKPLNFPTDS